MLVPNRNYQSPEYRYGFQGQEKDDEIKGNGNSINYKYRMHDPRVGHFFAIDPLSHKFPHNSTYAFSENRVIDAIELEGAEDKIIKYEWNHKSKMYVHKYTMGMGLKLFQSGIRTVYEGVPMVKKGFDYRAIYEPNKWSLVSGYDVQSKSASRSLRELKLFQELKNQSIVEFSKGIDGKYVGLEGKVKIVLADESVKLIKNGEANKLITKSNINPKIVVEGNLILLKGFKVGAKFSSDGSVMSRMSLGPFKMDEKYDSEGNFEYMEMYFKASVDNKSAGATQRTIYKYGVFRDKPTVTETPDDIKEENKKTINEDKKENDEGR